MREASAIICSLLLITLHSSSFLPVADSRNPFPGKNTSSGSPSHSQAVPNFDQVWNGNMNPKSKSIKNGNVVAARIFTACWLLVSLLKQDHPKTLNGSGRGLMGRIGSSPPSCTHRCRGCSPCDAIQIPAITDRRSVEYANYEPEGWKCKCGPHFFDP